MKKYIYILAATCLSFNLTGQTIDSTSLPSEQVEVVKYFKTTLEDAEMISIDLPKIPEQAAQKDLGLNYIINPPAALNVEIPSPEIRALAFTEDKEFHSNNGILKLGYGNLKSPEALGHYHYFIEDWFEVGLKGNFYSAQSNTDETQSMTDSGLGAYAAYFLNPRTKVKFEANGSWDKMNFYNLTRFGMAIDDLERKITDYNLVASLHHAPFQNKKILLNSDLYLDNIMLKDTVILDNIKSKETTIGIQNHWGKRFGNNSEAGFYLDSDFSATSTVAGVDTSYSRIILEPYLIFAGGALSTKLGVQYHKTNNINTNNKNILWPMIDITYGLRGTGININLGSHLVSQVNNVRHFTQISKFWTARLNNTLPFTIGASKSIYIGFSGDLNRLNYGFKALRISHKDYALLYNLINGLSYLTNDFNETNLQLDIHYQLGILGIGLDLEKRFFNIPDGSIIESKITYNPDFVAGITLSQSLLNGKFRLSQTFVHQSERDIFDFDIFSTLSSINDLNLKVDYQLSKFFNVYGEFNNVLNSKYEIYQGFENFGFNFHGGVKLVF